MKKSIALLFHPSLFTFSFRRSTVCFRDRYEEKKGATLQLVEITHEGLIHFQELNLIWFEVASAQKFEMHGIALWLCGMNGKKIF